VWDVFGETQSKQLQKLQNKAARIILNISNDVDYTIALRTLGWETERKKTKARMMYKLLNKMGPKSLTNLFSFKSQKTNYHLRDVSSGLYLPKLRTNSMKKVLCTTEQTFGILYQKKLGRASHFLPFEIKSLLTLVLGNLCKYNLPVNSSKHLLYLFNLYITVIA
jgi:hypothetical protein